jgi:hypothetical protein
MIETFSKDVDLKLKAPCVFISILTFTHNIKITIMKKTVFLKTCLYLFIAALFSSCYKHPPSYIPDISVPFTNKASAVNDAYIFTVENDGAYTSPFTGDEDLNYSTQYTFSGNFTNTNISFVFTSGPKTGTKYSGTISGSGNNVIITINTPTGKIVLSR